MILILFDLLCSIILVLSSVITTVFSRLQNYIRQQTFNISSSISLPRLQEAHSALLLQQDELSQQNTELELLINSITQSLSSTLAPTQNTTTTPTPSSLIPSLISTDTNTPQRSLWHRIRCSSIGRPYPLPFTPPRTPEELRRNNIVEWINDLIDWTHWQTTQWLDSPYFLTTPLDHYPSIPTNGSTLATRIFQQ